MDSVSVIQVCRCYRVYLLGGWDVGADTGIGTSTGRDLSEPASCGVLGWSECLRGERSEWSLLLHVDCWRFHGDAEDADTEIVSNDHRIARMLMFMSFPVMADERVALGERASSSRKVVYAGMAEAEPGLREKTVSGEEGVRSER